MIFSSNEVIAPGIVANLSPDRNVLQIGECDDRPTARIEKLRAVFGDASIASPAVPQIRETIWSKLLTNMSMSVLCLLTGQTARAVRDDPALRDVIPRLLDEANSIAQSYYPRRQARHPQRPGARPQAFDPAGLRTRPRHGDRRAGEGARRVREGRGLSTPMLDLLAGLAIRQARDKGLYQG